MEHRKALALPKSRSRDETLLDRSILLDEREGPPLVRGALIFGFLIVVLFIAWTAFMGLEEIEVATGEIIPGSDSIRIQHPIGGQVVEVSVREGSRVGAGDVLLRMKSDDSETQRMQLRAQLYSLMAQRERLDALIEGRSPDFSFLPPDAAQYASDQKSIYSANQALTRLTLDLIQNQAVQTNMEIERISQSRSALDRQKALAEEDASIVSAMVNNGAAAKSELIAKLGVLERLKEESESLASDTRMAEQRMTATTARIQEYLAGQDTQNREELASINARINQIDTSLRRLDSSAVDLEIRSPVDGLVHAPNYQSVGMVVPAGAVIMEVIPIGEARKAQIRIDPKSIGSVGVGQAVRLKITAYPYDRYGSFVGTLTEISPTTFIGGDGRPYYRGTVLVQGRELEDSAALDLVPGMTLSAEMKTGKKTLLQYLLKPIFASAREAFREK